MTAQVATEKALSISLRALPSTAKTENVPEWMKELNARGWTVVKQCLSRDKALAYADKGYEWLENWDLGFNRHDPASRTADKVPWMIRGGLYNRYGVAHEQFVWDLKSEPALVEKFARIWGTEELVVSYDGLNLSVADQSRAKSDPVFQPWAHVDQSPYLTNLQCIQGIMNLLPNGPDDGGLMVLAGSNAHYAELWQVFDHKKGPDGWNKHQQQTVDEEICQWLIDQKGCYWHKVCAEPGDLLLWDSRTIHYGAAPSAANDRFAAYVCYKPATLVPDEAVSQRAEAFANKVNTPHDPAIVRPIPRLPGDETHVSYAQAASRPLPSPVLSPVARKLAGLDKY